MKVERYAELVSAFVGPANDRNTTSQLSSSAAERGPKSLGALARKFCHSLFSSVKLIPFLVSKTRTAVVRISSGKSRSIGLSDIAPPNTESRDDGKGGA